MQEGVGGVSGPYGKVPLFYMRYNKGRGLLSTVCVTVDGVSGQMTG
jgi:hypothetical protein